MVSAFQVVIIVLPLYWLISRYRALQHNIAAAKSSGLPYIVTPFYLYHRFWLITNRLWLPLMRRLPKTWVEPWIDFLGPDWVWQLGYDPFEKHGDTFLTVAPERSILWTVNAETIHQITSQRDRFPKPLEEYKVLDIYGRNVVTTEGMDWRLHRKAASPGFNERNNALVFKESISQAQSMLRKWTGPNGEGNFTLKDIPSDTMKVTLHIISRVGFGVRLLWPGENSSEGENSQSGSMGGNEPPQGFTMSFERALSTLLDKVILVIVAPRWFLKYFPSKITNEALEAHDNWGLFMKKLYDQKVAEFQSGEHGEAGMDIMGSLVKGQKFMDEEGKASFQRNSSDQNGQQGLTEANVLGNSFVMLLAGHETTANTIHFGLVHLAANPGSQRRLQKDVVSIFGNAPSSMWDYDRDINKCLGSMLGASLNETLRIMPPVVCIPKSVHASQDQVITIDGKKIVLPKGSFINLNVCGVQRSPKYWPSQGPSKITDKPNDIDDFIPERWLNKNGNGEETADHADSEEEEDLGGFTGGDTAAQLFRPVRCSFVPFSDGPRSCLGRRMAQVEVVAVLAVIFEKHSVELAVDEWANDEEVDKMTVQERKVLYQKAQLKARETLRTATTLITLKLQEGETYIPLRIVRKGDERFVNIIN